MKYFIYCLSIVLSALPVISFAAKHDDSPKQDHCYVHLYDGSKFKGDNLVIYGEAEWKELDQLPNAQGKNWTDEADSFKVGPKTKLTIWTKTNFKGKSQEFTEGEYPSEDEPYSLKISCD